LAFIQLGRGGTTAGWENAAFRRRSRRCANYDRLAQAPEY
jgi:hypothetical protein